jgi:hypothetical protein
LQAGEESISYALISPMDTREVAVVASKSSDAPTLRRAFDEACAQMSPRWAASLKLWLGADGAPMILEDVGSALGVTRERARQLRNRALQDLRERNLWPLQIEARVQKLLSKRSKPLFLDTIGQEDPWFDGYHDNPELLVRLINSFSSQEFHSWALCERPILTRVSSEHWKKAVHTAIAILARRVVDHATQDEVEDLLRSIATGFKAPELGSTLFEYLKSKVGFTSGADNEPRLVYVDGEMTQLMRMILGNASTALHVREVGAKMEALGAGRLSKITLRRIADRAGAVRTSRSTIAMPASLPLSKPERKQIVAAFEAIISKGARGRQWHCWELVDIVIASQPKFAGRLDPYVADFLLGSSEKVRSLGRHVWMAGRSATTRSADRHHLATLCELAVERAGRPLSASELRRAVVRVRGLAKNFQVHPSNRLVRVATGKWGLIDRDVQISAEIRTRAVTALQDAHMARAEGLKVSQLMSAIPGDLARSAPDLRSDVLLCFVARDPRFRIERRELVLLRAWREAPPLTIGQAMESVMSESERPMTTAELSSAVRQLIKRNFSRNGFRAGTRAAGLVQDRESWLWSRASDE